jgi:hypothetical protein
VHARPDPEGLGLALVRLGLAASYDDEMGILARLSEGGDGVGQALTLEGVSDEEDDLPLGPNRELPAQTAVFRAREASHLDGRRDDVDPLCGDAVDTDQVVAHLFRHHRRADVAPGPKLQALDRPHRGHLGMEDRRKPRPGLRGRVTAAGQLRPARLLRRHDRGHVDDVVLPGRHADHVDEVVAAAVGAQRLRRPRGEAPAQEREREP